MSDDAATKPSPTSFDNEWELDPAFEPRHLTGMGNAQRFVEQHCLDLKYVHVWKHWLVWDGRRFRADQTGEVMRRAKKTVASIYAEAANEDDAERRQAIAAWARQSESEARLREMLNLAACELPLLPDQLDANPWYITVTNGTVNLRTGELLPHSRNDFSTKLAPVPFEKNAECPRWLALLDRVFGGDQELIAYVQRAVGYSLTGDTSEQVLFFLYGRGSNGKTTLLECLRTLLGDYAFQADFTTFLARRSDGGPRNDIARLRGARFVAATEAGEGHRLAEDLVKQLTGGDTVAARFLYSESFEFQPRFKLWLAANHKPVIRGTDDAIWRRIRLIPFTVTIPEDQRNRALLGLLRTELPGILRWAIEGCLAWQREGLCTPPAVRDATVAYRVQMDDLAAFLEECCVRGPTRAVDAGRLYHRYVRWCKENGEPPSTQRTLGLRLKERGLDQVRGSGGVRRWAGLSVVTEVTDSDADSHELRSASLHEGNYPDEASLSVTSVTTHADGAGNGGVLPCEARGSSGLALGRNL